jgi:hypothetical protein
MRAIANYEQYKAILPYASEIFGVYQPMIGWKSKRQLDRTAIGQRADHDQMLVDFASNYDGLVNVTFNQDHFPELESIEPGILVSRRLILYHSSELLTHVANNLREELDPQDIPQDADEWNHFINRDELKRILSDLVFPAWKNKTSTDFHALAVAVETPLPNETVEERKRRVVEAFETLEDTARQQLERESAIAGMLADLLDKRATATLESIFYGTANVVSSDNVEAVLQAMQPMHEDPFATFDPKADILDVSLSPIGIVHLFRQFFFEFDTFLGTPTSHVWLSPGSTVELIETSSRKTTTERTLETVLESITKTERATTEQEDLSEATKQENRDDTKIGFSTTVNQSWGTGNATATGSLNLDRTQQTAREDTHKRMRQQSDKLSTEIRQNFKSTFKTVTEVTDVSSKRYVLANNTTPPRLINYELRRKMRQVGVQVQDMGTYLCWQTFVDEPGKALGLADLVHIAQPAELVAQPDQNAIPNPPRVEKPFQVSASWNYGDTRKFNGDLGFVPLTQVPLPVQPDAGYELERPPNDEVYLGIVSISGDGNADLGFKGKLIGSTQIRLGVITGPGGLEWDERVDYVLSGAVAFKPTETKLKEIEAANAKIVSDGKAATRANERASREAFVKAAKERVEQASKVKTRKFEDLREEERTVVYRALIKDLMMNQLYRLPDRDANLETRHVLSELINAIFDIDKMLYFVASEWWKPRKHYSQFLAPEGNEGKALGKSRPTSHGVFGADQVVNWSDNEARQDNYYITNDSEVAKLGSSLGWLLQLDGDNLRNAFLNAPWVKAVIPVRPGKEQAAISWLQNVNVEGASGMDKPYSAPQSELEQIRNELLAENPDDPVAEHPTISDAIRYLCLQVSRKYAESLKVKKFPNGVGIQDDDKVSATPIEKVYEHGFYPLHGGFRVNPMEPDPTNPDRNFQVFDQWVEILPTDQIVPVEVRYNPTTGRQIPLDETTDPDTDPHP